MGTRDTEYLFSDPEPTPFINPDLYGAVKHLTAKYGTQEVMAAVREHLEDLAEMSASEPDDAA